MVGIEFPKEHDVSDVLEQNFAKYPSWFSERIPSMARVSRGLFLKKVPSMYGEETLGRGPGELFSREGASKASAEAVTIYKLVARLVRSYSRG